MNFNFLYDKFKKLKFDCNIIDKFEIKKIVFGSGGSDNIILDATLDHDKLIAKINLSWSNDKLILAINLSWSNDKLIAKIILNPIYLNVKIKPDHDQLEISFYYFFTKKYVLGSKSI